MCWADCRNTGMGPKEVPAFNPKENGVGPSHLDYYSRLSPVGEKPCKGPRVGTLPLFRCLYGISVMHHITTITNLSHQILVPRVALHMGVQRTDQDKPVRSQAKQAWSQVRQTGEDGARQVARHHTFVWGFIIFERAETGKWEWEGEGKTGGMLKSITSTYLKDNDTSSFAASTFLAHCLERFIFCVLFLLFLLLLTTIRFDTYLSISTKTFFFSLSLCFLRLLLVAEVMRRYSLCLGP